MASFGFESKPLDFKTWLSIARKHVSWFELSQFTLGVVGLVSICFGLWNQFQTSNAPPCFLAQTELHDTSFSSEDGLQNDSSSELSSEVKSEVTVYISGAVNDPGLVQVPTDARLAQAVEQAGGLHTDAHSEYIARHLNLASKVQDQLQVYIPFAHEVVSEQEVVVSQPLSASETASGTLVSINTATASQLEELPMIGSKRAESILAGRPYHDVRDLLNKEVVTQGIYDEIKDKISL